MAKINYFDDLYRRFTSRKFLAFIGITVLLLLDGFGYINIDPTTKTQLLIVVLGYIGVEGGVDIIRK